MCSPSPPPAPDYRTAARETAAGDLAVARQQTRANRPDIFTPEGSRTWTQGTGLDQAGFDAAQADYNQKMGVWDAATIGSGKDQFNTAESRLRNKPVAPDRASFMQNPDYWVGTTELNPEAQKAFESQQRIASGLANLGEDAVGQVGDLFSSRFSTTGTVPEYQGPGTFGENRQRVSDAMMARVDTDIGRDREAVSANLIAQGIPPGSEAYNRQMEQLDRKQTDARQQAEIAAQQQAGLEYQSALAGLGADYRNQMATRRQQIQESLLNRQTPLNEISAFRTGSQVGMPQFQAYGNQQFTGGPDYMGAAGAQGQYDIASNNARQAGKNALMGGMFNLGAGGLAGGYF